MVGLMILMIIFLVILILVNLSKTEESEKSVLMRIMTNYLQVITTFLSFNINFPNVLGQIFAPVDKLGSTSTPFISFDCFARKNELALFTPSSMFLKAFLSGILPIAMFMASLIIWTIIYFTIRKWCKDFKRNLVVTNVVILFLLHPNLTRTFFTIFQ